MFVRTLLGWPLWAMVKVFACYSFVHVQYATWHVAGLQGIWHSLIMFLYCFLTLPLHMPGMTVEAPVRSCFFKLGWMTPVQKHKIELQISDTEIDKNTPVIMCTYGNLNICRWSISTLCSMGSMMELEWIGLNLPATTRPQPSLPVTARLQGRDDVDPLVLPARREHAMGTIRVKVNTNCWLPTHAVWCTTANETFQHVWATPHNICRSRAIKLMGQRPSMAWKWVSLQCHHL